LQEDREAVWRRALEAVKNGILTPNEARVMLGYDEVEGGDMLMMPANMIPLTVMTGEGVNEE